MTLMPYREFLNQSESLFQENSIAKGSSVAFRSSVTTTIVILNIGVIHTMKAHNKCRQPRALCALDSPSVGQFVRGFATIAQIVPLQAYRCCRR